MRDGIRRTGLRATRAARDPRFVAVAVLMVVSALISGMNLGSDRTSATPIGPKEVRGYVWNQNWDPVANANVTVKSYNGAVLVKTMYYDATEPNGFYKVTFINSEWDIGYTFEITARYLSYEGINATTAANEDWPYQWLNASIVDPEIPEFGYGITASLTVVVLVAAIAVITSRRRRGS